MKTLKFALSFLSLILLTSFKNQGTVSKASVINSNFAKVKDNLFFSKYETSNKEYREFLSSLKQGNEVEKYNQSLLDTSLWAMPDGLNKPYTAYYHSHVAYNNYPVVSVSYEQATNYCAWLTRQYNADATKAFKKVVFRLPTEAEWMYAASGGKEGRIYAWDGEKIIDKKGRYLANIKASDFALAKEGRQKITAPTKSFLSNEFGLYNTIGNVAEMTAERGVAKGGSYNDTEADAQIGNKKKYEKASTEVGFRVVMEVLEK